MTFSMARSFGLETPSVVLGVSPDLEYQHLPKPVRDPDQESVRVPLDVEHDPVLTENARARVPAFHVVRCRPVGLLGLRQPGVDLAASIRVEQLELVQGFLANDIHPEP